MGWGAWPHHGLGLSSFPQSCYFCVSCEFSVQHSAEEVLNISSRAVCLHTGPEGRQALCAQWSRARILEPDFLDSIRSPSFPVPGIGSFCLCSIGLTQVWPASRVSGLWSQTDLDCGLCHFTNLRKFLYFFVSQFPHL